MIIGSRRKSPLTAAEVLPALVNDNDGFGFEPLRGEDDEKRDGQRHQILENCVFLS